MKHKLIALAILAQIVPVGTALSQPPASADATATDGPYPEAFKIGKGKTGTVYTDARGMTLYTVSRRLGGIRTFGFRSCTGPCAKIWSPVAAPAGAAPIGQWTVVTGAQGPQWAYKTLPVFTFKAERGPGTTDGDGYDDMWAAIAHIPPVPTIVAPGSVKTSYVDGAYILVDPRGHALFTAAKAGRCGAACAHWSPLGAGMAGHAVGDWSVVSAADRPQWAWRGKPVFVSDESEPGHVADGGTILKP